MCRSIPSGQFLWEVASVEDGPPRLGLWDVADRSAHPRLAWSRPTRPVACRSRWDGAIVALEGPSHDAFVMHDVRGKERGADRVD